VTIELRGAGHVYSEGTPWAHRALWPIDLELPTGSALLVVGANGSGKSTLAWILAGLLAPSEGSATLDGRPLDECLGSTAMTFQHARLQLFRTTVASEVAFGSRPLTDAEVDEALDLVGLDAASFRDRRIDELSGGEQRRVALAGALARRPQVLVLDEPLAGLDRRSRVALLDVLVRLRDRTGTSTVMVTHDLAGAERLSDRTIALAGGRVAFDGPTAEVRTA